MGETAPVPAISPPPAPFLIDTDKSLDGAVICSLNIIREKACRQLTRLPVMLKALAANALPPARLVSTVAFRLILIYAAFPHIPSPFQANIILE
jgi:hypothetical protein